MRLALLTLAAWLSSSITTTTVVAWVPTAQRMPTALASAMTPLFPTQAWEGKEFRVTELQDMFAQAMQNFQSLMASSSPASPMDFDTNVKIAASVATAVRGNVVSNEEMYNYVRQGIDQLVTTLAQVLAQLDGFSIEQKIAAALATVVISYPLSYQYYQYELAEEERLAAEKKAKIAIKKKADAAKAKAEAEKGKESKKTKTVTTMKVDKVTAVTTETEEKPLPKGPKGAKKEQLLTMNEEPPELIQQIGTAQAIDPLPMTLAPVERTVTVQVPVSPRVMESTFPVMGNQAEDGGMDAYARAYAAMLSQVQAVQVDPIQTVATEPVASTPPPSFETSSPIRSSGNTASYLESLSRSS